MEDSGNKGQEEGRHRAVGITARRGFDSCVFYLAICILKRSKSISVARKDEFRGTHTLALGKSCPNFWEDACLFFRNSPGFRPSPAFPPAVPRPGIPFLI